MYFYSKLNIKFYEKMLHLINVHLYISIVTKLLFTFTKMFLKIETNWCLSSSFQHYFSILVALHAIMYI